VGRLKPSLERVSQIGYWLVYHAADRQNSTKTVNYET